MMSQSLMLTKPRAELTLFDTLSRLTFARVTKLLGAEGDRLIAAGGKYDIDITIQVEFERDRFRLAVDSATVTLAQNGAAAPATCRASMLVPLSR